MRAGESVTVEVPEPRATELAPEDIPLSILYEDDQLLAIDKPAGLVVHPAPGHPSGTLVNALLHHVRDLAGVGGELRPGIVHRFDRDTSGVLLVAKTDRAHQMLSRQMRRRSLRKEYLALVAGVPRVRKGEVTFAIGRDPQDRKRMKAVRPTAEGPPAGTREAKTLYELEREWFPLGLDPAALPPGHGTHAPDSRPPGGDRDCPSWEIRSTGARAIREFPREPLQTRLPGVPAPGPPCRAGRVPASRVTRS